jgi:positive regulator of sigma E activity
MSRNQEIRHEGMIEQVTETCYLIKIERATSCQNCTAKSYCNLSDKNDLLSIPKETSQYYQAGDKITVIASKQKSWIALLLGYLFPFIILISGILIAAATGLPQGISGIIGIASLLLYYLIFALFRKKIDRQFTFKIEP